MNKQKLIEKLEKTYCRIMKSGVDGIGVFAIQDIPEGVDPFAVEHMEKWTKFHISELQGLNKDVLKFVEDFYTLEEDGGIEINDSGLYGMNMSFYLNHSKLPNVRVVDDGRFFTLRKIKKGEELLVDYSTYDCKWK